MYLSALIMFSRALPISLALSRNHDKALSTSSSVTIRARNVCPPPLPLAASALSVIDTRDLLSATRGQQMPQDGGGGDGLISGPGELGHLAHDPVNVTT
jgi:hypothetical protein